MHVCLYVHAYVCVCVCVCVCVYNIFNLNEIFLETIHVINVKLCLMVVFIELHPFMLLSAILTLFQGQSGVNLK